jgi:Xaa-Pro aminopeptidase
MQREGLDAFVVSSPFHVRYLSGFSGSNGLCVVRRSGSFLLTDGRYRQQAEREVKSFRRVIESVDLFEAIAKHRLLKGCKAVGFQSHVVTYAQYRTLRRLIPAVSFVPTNEIVEDIALVKDEEEVGHLQDAVRISDRVFCEVLPSIRPGTSELEVAAEIGFLHRRYGAEKDAFDPIVASGERGAFPHARATTKKIRNGELVTIDFGCTVGGYNSDITRTVAVGRVSGEARRIYGIVLDAQCASIEAARGDMPAKDLDAVARQRIKKGGLGRFFIHSLGHGLGLQVHERPRVSYMSKEQLRAGSVITVEPGVYIPGLGGVRIEDDVLLTSKGCEVLSSAPKELINI